MTRHPHACQFAEQPGADGLFHCPRCGLASPLAVLNFCGAVDPASEPVEWMACRHLGAQLHGIAKVKCQTCRGNVRMKLPVFACALHGRCIPEASTAAEDGTRGCVGCGDRS